jgi:hypothetical protein
MIIEEEYAEGPMQRTLLMGAQFAHGADRFIALVHQYHLFLVQHCRSHGGQRMPKLWRT